MTTLILWTKVYKDPSGSSNGKESACNDRLGSRNKRQRFDPWVEKIPWSRKWQPNPVFLLGGQGSLADYGPGVLKEPDMMSMHAQR